MIGDRVLTYDALSTGLSYLTDREILATFKKGSSSEGWSLNTVSTYNGHKLFMKLLPLPTLEASRPFDTGNLYHLPVEMNRSGTGVNAWRELLVLVKTTNWVLSGRIQNFPLLYHYRIVKRRPKKNTRMIIGWEQPRVRERLNDMQAAEFSLLLCIEYIGPTIVHWLNSPRRLISYLAQSKTILRFLEDEGVLLLDRHAGNILVDSDDIVYYTDFGLVLDKQFRLSSAELRFFEANRSFPYAQVFSNPFFTVFERKDVLAVMRRKFGFGEDFTIRNDILPHLFEFCKLMGYTARGVIILKKYGQIVSELGKAYETFPMKYPSRRMKRLIEEVL